MNATTRRIVFEAPNRVALEEESGTPACPAGGAIVETRYSCISAGTELAKLSGLEPVVYPCRIGNRAIGRVVEVGPDAPGPEPGTLVFTHTAHADYAEAKGLVAPLPDGLDRPEAALMGMAMVAMTALRVAPPELGDVVAVAGAGLVGQFAARLATLAGARTIVIDRVAGRLDVARGGGAWRVVDASRDDPAAVVPELTGGRGADLIYECTGAPEVIEACPAFAARSATLALVGSPRGETQTNLTPFLQRFHLWREHGDLRLVGAHEWKIPLAESPFHRHSQIRNARTLATLMESGRLKTDDLLTHVFRPDECAEAYRKLAQDRDEALGVVFDWTSTEGAEP